MAVCFFLMLNRTTLFIHFLVVLFGYLQALTIKTENIFVSFFCYLIFLFWHLPNIRLVSIVFLPFKLFTKKYFNFVWFEMYFSLTAQINIFQALSFGFAILSRPLLPMVLLVGLLLTWKWIFLSLINYIYWHILWMDLLLFFTYLLLFMLFHPPLFFLPILLFVGFVAWVS